MNGYEKSPLVLLHGFPLNARMWDSVTEPLSRIFKVHVLELPGFGRQVATEINSLAAWAKDVQQQLQERHITEPIQLCGLSMGGYVAMEFADLFPDRLARLILCDTKTEADSPEAKNSRLALAASLHSSEPQSRQQAINSLAVDMPKKLLATRNQGQNAPIVKTLAGMIGELAPNALANAQLAMAARRDTTEIITNLSCPVLGIVGEEDQITPPELMQSLISRCQKGTLKRIAGAGHLPPMETPAEFVSAVIGE